MDVNSVVGLLVVDVPLDEAVEFFWVDSDETEELLDDVGFAHTDVDDAGLHLQEFDFVGGHLPVGVEPFDEQGVLVMQVLGHFLLVAAGDGLDFADEFGEECLLMGDLLLELGESVGGGLMVLVDVSVADGEELGFS